jgi:hypothetical protein
MTGSAVKLCFAFRPKRRKMHEIRFFWGETASKTPEIGRFAPFLRHFLRAAFWGFASLP